MLDYLRKRLIQETLPPEPLPEWDLRDAKISHDHDELLPEDVSLRISVRKGEFAHTHKVILVEKESTQTQLGYMVLQHIFSNELWRGYMENHGIDDLWIDKMDLTSLTPHRGIGTALWNVSHKIIKPGGYRSLIDTSKGWSQRKILEAEHNKVFKVLNIDRIMNYGKSFRRYLVQYL